MKGPHTRPDASHSHACETDARRRQRALKRELRERRQTPARPLGQMSKRFSFSPPLGSGSASLLTSIRSNAAVRARLSAPRCEQRHTTVTTRSNRAPHLTAAAVTWLRRGAWWKTGGGTALPGCLASGMLALIAPGRAPGEHAVRMSGGCRSSGRSLQ